jgi:hypothetical protein
MEVTRDAMASMHAKRRRSTNEKDEVIKQIEVTA